MAGDWIKVEKATARKPEVLRVATELGVHPDHAFGLCFRFWSWCDDQLTDGHALGVTLVTLDTVIGHAGFATALVNVGWLRVRVGENSLTPPSIEVPHFDRHLSESAKNRALSSKRQQKRRSNDVTETSRSQRDKSVTREEKRRVSLSNESDDARTREPPESPSEAAERPPDGPAQWAEDERRLIAAWNACPRGARGVVEHRGLVLSPKLREAFRCVWSDPVRRSAMFDAIARIKAGIAFEWERPALSLAKFLESDEIDKITGGGHAKHTRATERPLGRVDGAADVAARKPQLTAEEYFARSAAERDGAA